MTQTFDTWMNAVGTLFQTGYCLTLNDIGADEDVYLLAFSSGESANAYVDAYARKYDLTHIHQVSF